MTPAPKFVPDWTKTGDVFVDRKGREYVYVKRETNQQGEDGIYLSEQCDNRNGYTGVYQPDGKLYWYKHPCDEDIVSQYTPATAPQGVDVPQWCWNAAYEINGTHDKACYCTSTCAGAEDGSGDLLQCVPCKLREAQAALAKTGGG